jgi:hypothetical protein
MDLDAEADLQGANKKQNLKKSFMLIPFLRHIYIIFQRQKVQKKSQNTENSKHQGFFYYFCLMMVRGCGS